MIKVDLGFRNGVVRIVYLVLVMDRDAAAQVDGMDEVIRMEIPAGLKVVGLTKHDLFSAITQFRAQTREAK